MRTRNSGILQFNENVLGGTLLNDAYANFLIPFPSKKIFFFQKRSKPKKTIFKKMLKNKKALAN